MREAIRTRTPRVRRCGRGFAAEGPGFFVWDRDPGAVADAALLLSRGAPPTRTPERLVVIERATAPLGADPASLDA